MAKDKTIVIRGTLDWAKITGDARPHTGSPKYDKGPLWSVDVTPDAKSRDIIAEAGITSKLRTPGNNDNRTETFLTLKQLLNRSDGKKNEPPRIRTARDEPWDDSNIGNGSVADVKIKVVDYGPTSDKGAYLQAIRVMKHIPYESDGFAPLTPDDEYFAATTDDVQDAVDKPTPSTAKGNGKKVNLEADELEDEIPF